MATLAATGLWEINSGATAGNVNGGYFNPSNANVIADGAVLLGTTTAPTISSTIGAFVAADVGAWVWFPTQTSMNAGAYKIQSVAGGVATLSAAIGSTQVEIYLNNRCTRPTLQGCATTNTVNSVSFLVDYSRGTAAIAAFTNLGSANGSTTLTDNSSGGLMRKTFAGNGICLSSGTNALVTWYEVVSQTNSNNVVLNVTPHGANTMSATTGKIGGAISLGGSTANITDSDLMNTVSVSSVTGAMQYFILGGSSITYTLGVAVTFKQGSATWPTVAEGYVTARGDRPTDATRPTFACGANVFTKSGKMFSIKFTGTGTSVVSNGAAQTGGFTMASCKVVNSSATAGRAALLARNSNGGTAYQNEFISYRGIAVSDIVAALTSAYFYNYVHDSNIGFTISPSALGSGQVTIMGNIIEGCVTYGIDGVNAIPPDYNIIDNTFYGAENKLGIGLGVQTADAQDITALGNIFYGLATAISVADVQAVWTADFNNFFNNTNDINTANHWQKGANDVALNPTFTSVAQITGTTATTTAGNHLVQAGATFVTSGVTAGRDYVYIKSGTGVTAGIYGILSVDSETQITADITLAADATGDKSWQITTGHNFAIGTNLKGLGIPNTFPAGLSIGSTDIGAVERVEAGMIRARSFGGM